MAEEEVIVVAEEEPTVTEDQQLDPLAQAMQSGDWPQLETLCREELQAGETARVLGILGAALRRQNRLDEARDTFVRAVALPDVSAAEWFNYGNLLLDRGRTQDASDAYESAILLDEHMIPALLQSARCAMYMGDFALARQRFERLLNADPKNFSGWLEAGHAFRHLGATKQMLESYQEAIRVAPARYEAFAALARAYTEAHNPGAAEVNYHRAILRCASKTEERRVHQVMGQYRLSVGDVPGAMDALRSSLLCAELEHPRPDDNALAEILIDFAQAMWRLNMPESEQVFGRASQATAESTLTRLSEVLYRNNEWQSGLNVLRRNVELYPESQLAHWNLAYALIEAWQLDEGLAELARAEAIGPLPQAKGLRAKAASSLGDADEALRLYRELAEEEGVLSLSRASAAMASLYSDKLSPEDAFALHRDLFVHLGDEARPRTSFHNDCDPARRLRIGLVTSDLHHQHPVNIFMQPVLARLNREALNVHVYFTGKAHDDQTRLAQSRVDRWQECVSWTDAQLAARIESDGIDILIDLFGLTSGNRAALFARRAAPVQTVFLGYPSSTGIPNMDWILADAEVAPAEHDSLYSEKVLRLPNTVFCFAPEEDYPFPQFTDDRASRPLTFGSFNNIPKLTPGTIRAWSKILATLPDSRLLLKAPSFGAEGAVQRFTELFAAEGIDASRLELRGPTGLSIMMGEYADVDIALDPFPYNGGTTTMQALWMGAPVVSLEGDYFHSRMGASFLRAAGLSDWVAGSEAEYVGIAVRMGQDRAALLELKRGLRENLLSKPAWNIDAYTQDFEAALRRMWEAWCAKKK